MQRAKYHNAKLLNFNYYQEIITIKKIHYM